MGSMGEIMTVVLGDSLPIRSTFCIKSLRDFRTSSGPPHLTLLRLLIPTCIHIFCVSYTSVGINLLNSVGGDPVIAYVRELYVFSIAVTHHQQRLTRRGSGSIGTKR